MKGSLGDSIPCPFSLLRSQLPGGEPVSIAFVSFWTQTIVNVKIRMYIFFNLRMYKNIKISVYELLFLRKIIL